MSDFDVTKLNRTSDVSTGSTPQPTEVKPADNAKPTIFAGMTKLQAEEAGILDLFTKANVDGGDDISENEYNTFITNTQNVAETEETTPTATTPKTTEHTEEKHEVHEEGHEHKHQCSHDHSEDKPAIIFAGMTRAQAEEAAKTNPEILEVFNKYAENNVITGKKFGEYKKTLHTHHKLDKEAFSQLSTTEKVDHIQEQLSCHNDEQLAIEEYKDKDLTTAIQMMNDKLPEEERISVEKWNNSTPEERGKLISKIYLKNVNAALKEDSPEYQAQLERLKNGEFTEHEIEELGLNKDIKLTDEQLKKYTQNAIMRSYKATIANLIESTGDKQQDENMLALLEGFKTGMLQDEEVTTLLNTLGMHKIADKVKQRQAAKIIASQEIKSTDETANYMLADAVVQYGDEETIKTFIESNKNNPNNTELIATAITNIINTLPDGNSKKAELQAALESIQRNENTNGIGRSNILGVSTQSTHSEYPTLTTNPISRGSYPTLAEIKELSRQMYASSKEPDGEKFDPREYSDPSIAEMEKMLRKWRTKFKIRAAHLKNMSTGDAWSAMASHLSHVPPHVQGFFLKMIKQAPPQKQIAAFIDGSPELQKIMRQNQIVNNTMLYSYLSTHPAELNNAPVSIQEMYQEIKSEINKPYESQTV